MELPGFIKTINAKLDDDGHWLTRRKLALFGFTLILTGLIAGVFESVPEPESADFSEVIDLSLPRHPAPASVAAVSVDGSPQSQPGLEPGEWKSVTVRSGQTLDAIFRQQGYSIPLLHRILALNGDTKGLTRIRPGDVFDFRTDDAGYLAEMRYPLDEARYLIVRQLNGELFAEILEREIAAEVAESEGIIDSSLFVAGKQAGLSDAMVMKLANIFGWDIDFVLDIRKGDRFMLVYEKLYREGEFLREGEIFAPDGRNMRKAFLRAPLNFSYISSNFNPRRMHPVLKRLRPHNGIDYYAPRGTPVYAAGDGTVTRSTYSAANGNHVFIKHAGSIETKYLHFTKRLVKQGQKVRQGQTIGTVGSTGLSMPCW
jgi:murein DD-endopeptidase MepM/ murein hydrolase activator NlpD